MPFWRKNNGEKLGAWLALRAAVTVHCKPFSPALSLVDWETKEELFECPTPGEVLSCLRNQRLGKGKVKKKIALSLVVSNMLETDMEGFIADAYTA